MKKNLILFILSLALILFVAACRNNQKSSEMPGTAVMEHSKMAKGDTLAKSDPEFEKLCKDRTPDNWMNMKPMRDGKFTPEVSCWGCMSDDGMSHFCSMEEYNEYLKNEK